MPLTIRIPAIQPRGHAELAWAVARWIDTRLDDDGRRRVREAQARAVQGLLDDAYHEPDASLTASLGIPSASQAKALLDELATSLWSPAEAA